MNNKRRKFIKNAGLSVGAMSLGSGVISACGGSGAEQKAAAEVAQEAVKEVTSKFKISLAQWSLHKGFFGDALSKGWEFFGNALREDPTKLLMGELNPDDFPKIAKEQFGIDCIELVNTFYFGRVGDQAYWDAFKKSCDDNGVTVGLIMCDALGNLGDSDAAARDEAVKKHHAWVDIAKFLGAHSIRVNAAGQGTAEEVAANAIAGLSALTEYGAANGINIIVENHGGHSSNGQWLSNVISSVGSDYCGTLPDFGNFCIKYGENRSCEESYDRYQGMTDLMPYAKGVSAKSHEFDAEGNETKSDFFKIMKIVKDSGFEGYVGIEYEGSTLSEPEGIMATKALLEKTFKAV